MESVSVLLSPVSSCYVAYVGMGYVILLWHSLSLPYDYIKSLMGHAKFPDHKTSCAEEIKTRVKRVGYNLNVMRQSACLVFYPVGYMHHT